MEKRVLKRLRNKRKQIENKEKQITLFKENPLIFFTGLQEDRNIVPDSIREIGESALLEYQDWQYHYVIQAIQDNFRISPFTLHWNSDIFPSPIYLSRDGYPVAQINPYESTFELLPTQEMLEKLNEFKLYTKRKIDKWEEHQILLIKDWNPYVDADDSLSSTIKVLLKKNKDSKNRQNQLNLLEMDFRQLEEDSSRLLLQLENLSRQELTEHHDIDRVFNQIKNKLNLNYKDSHSEAILKVSEEISELEYEAEQRVEKLRVKAINTEQLI